MKIIEFTVTDQEGLHALPATALIEKLNKYKSKISASYNGYTVDAKSPFGLMSLGAKYGEKIIFTIEGEDEDTVVKLW